MLLFQHTLSQLQISGKNIRSEQHGKIFNFFFSLSKSVNKHLTELVFFFLLALNITMGKKRREKSNKYLFSTCNTVNFLHWRFSNSVSSQIFRHCCNFFFFAVFFQIFYHCESRKSVEASVFMSKSFLPFLNAFYE